MSTPSTIAAVTIALRNLVRAAVPAKVEVSTLPPAQAEKFRTRTSRLARVNVVFIQISTDATVRDPLPPHRDPLAVGEPPARSMVLRYLITVYGTASPEEEQSTERLIEAAYAAIHRKPVLTSADLVSALPGAAGIGATVTSRIIEEVLPFVDLASLFSAMNAEYRPSLVYAVTLSES